MGAGILSRLLCSLLSWWAARVFPETPVLVRREKDKNGVAALGFRHPQAAKLTFGSSQCVRNLVMGDKYANLARRFAFGILDGLEHTLIVYLC